MSHLIFTFNCWPYCTVWSLILQMLLASVHCMVMNPCKGIIKLNPTVLGRLWDLNPIIIDW